MFLVHMCTVHGICLQNTREALSKFSIEICACVYCTVQGIIADFVSFGNIFQFILPLFWLPFWSQNTPGVKWTFHVVFNGVSCQN